ITSIKGFAQLMRRRGEYSEQAVSTIVSQTDQLEGLVDDLLISSRLEAGRLELRRRVVDPASLVQAAVEEAQGGSALHSICLDQPKRPLAGFWDPDRLSQVLRNLLGNAVKYSPDGGRIEVRMQDLGTEVYVSVRDHGVGIAPDAIPQLFQRFY